MAAIVLYDACVLHPAPLRDLLLRTAGAGLFQAKLTEEILDECFKSILRERPDLKIARLDRTRRLMLDALPDGLVRNYTRLIAGLELPDPADRHVLAAALRSGAQTIVTFNLKHFPQAVLAGYDILALGNFEPDRRGRLPSSCMAGDFTPSQTYNNLYDLSDGG